MRTSYLYASRGIHAKGGGRGNWIRTSDFYLPKIALYQAELYPE